MLYPILNLLQQLLVVGLLLAASTVTPAAESAARWTPRTTNWNSNSHPGIGDWGFDRPGYPPGLYLQGVTVTEGERVANPVIYDNDVLDDVFDDELAMVMASDGEMNLVGLIVTPVLTDGWGFSKPEWIETAHAARRVAEQSGLRMERIPPITVGTEAKSEKAGEGKDSAGARLYMRLIHEQFARDPQRPLLVNIGGQGATLASAYTLDPTIADQCLVYYTDLRVYNGHFAWASQLIAKHFRVVSWGDDHWWIPKRAQNEWRVLPRPEKTEGTDNNADSGEWRNLTQMRVPLLDHLVKQFQTRGEYCQGERKGDGYLDGTFLHAWLPGIFDDAALKEIRGSEVLHVTRFTARNEDRVKAFANRRLLNPQAYRQAGVTSAANPAFPLRVSGNHRYLVDQRGAPFFYHADTAWMIFFKLNESEAAEYLAARKARGFNTVQVQLTGFLGSTNLAGQWPFAGKPPEQDFARPNEKFFAHVDRVVAEAERQSLLLAIAPAWSGCCGEGWAGKEKNGALKPLNANGAEKSRELGRWLGHRYGKFVNVMWILGGDNDPENAREEIRAMGLGLKETAPHHLITYHAASTHSSTDVWPANEPWLDVSMVYTYFRGFNKAWNKNQPDVYEVSHAEFAKTPVRPFFLGESTYEGEHGTWGSALQARKNAYWCALGGGFGHAYGSPNWNMPANWREVLNQPGAASLKHLRALFESRPWWKLQPDMQNIVAVEGRGAFATNDYAVTALAADGSFALSYLPTKRTLTIDLSKLSGAKVNASWFNPRTGEATPIGEFTDKKPHPFDSPADGDWVLVLDDAAKSFAKPGSL